MQGFLSLYCYLIANIQFFDELDQLQDEIKSRILYFKFLQVIFQESAYTLTPQILLFVAYEYGLHQSGFLKQQEENHIHQPFSIAFQV